MNKVLSFIQGLFRPQETDGALLFWAKEILTALLIVSFFWMLSGLVSAILNKWGKRLARFTATNLDDRIIQRLIPHISPARVEKNRNACHRQRSTAIPDS